LILCAKPINVFLLSCSIKVIECAALDGRKRQLLVTSVPHPYGITISGDFIYWTDWQQQAVNRANATTGNDIETVIDKLPGVMDLQAVTMDKPFS
jgi:Flp pilus assembly protein CpaB